MRVPWIVLAVVLGSVTAYPEPRMDRNTLREILSIPTPSVRNSALEQMILNLIEDLRQTMLTGSDTVPVLDPFYLDELFVDEILPFPDAKLAVRDLTATKLSTFEINSLTVRLASLLQMRYRIELDGEIPELDVEIGNYDMSLNVFGLNVFGNGDAKIKVIQPRIRASLLVSPRFSGGIYLNLVECQIRFNLSELQPQISGIFNDPGVSDFVSLFIKNLVGDLLEFYETDINDFLSATVHEIANEILADMDLGSIIG